MTMLAEEVDLVIGVDTHKHTNTAAVVQAACGSVLDGMTAPTSLDGHEAILEMALAHEGHRAWAIEGTSSYGAGLTRFLRERGEWVIELDRPARTTRRGGKKTDPLDAVRSAREALARPELGEPRSAGNRAALSVLLAARRSAVDARTVAPTADSRTCSRSTRIPSLPVQGEDRTAGDRRGCSTADRLAPRRRDQDNHWRASIAWPSGPRTRGGDRCSRARDRCHHPGLAS